MKKEDKTKAMVWVLAILLVIAFAYIVNGMYQQNRQEKQVGIFQQGAKYGFEQAVLQVMQQASTCQPVPLFVQNTTLNLIAVECLQQAQLKQPSAAESK